VSLTGEGIFLTLVPVVARQDGMGEEFDVNPPDTLAGLVALVDPRAFVVVGFIVTSLCAKIGKFRCVCFGDTVEKTCSCRRRKRKSHHGWPCFVSLVYRKRDGRCSLF